MRRGRQVPTTPGGGLRTLARGRLPGSRALRGNDWPIPASQTSDRRRRPILGSVRACLVTFLWPSLVRSPKIQYRIAGTLSSRENPSCTGLPIVFTLDGAADGAVTIASLPAGLSPGPEHEVKLAGFSIPTAVRLQTQLVSAGRIPLPAHSRG